MRLIRDNRGRRIAAGHRRRSFRSSWMFLGLAQMIALALGIQEARAVLTLADHPAGQESNAFGGSGTETNAELFAFSLDPGGSTVTITQLVFTLSDIAALSDGDWGGIEIIEDTNDDGTISGESTAVGGTGVVNTGSGTITFSTNFNVTVTTSYILRADFSTLTQCDAVKISLTTANITTGASKSGSTTPVTHAEAGAIQNLVGHWKLDDAAGLTATDSAGSNDGTLANGPTWTSGNLCGGLDFDAIDDHVDVGSGTDINDVFSGGGTGSAWIYPTGWGENSFGRIADKTSTVGAATGWALQVDGAGTRLRFETGFSTARGYWVTPNASLSLNSWYHVAVVFDSDSAANNPVFYINGVSQTVTEINTPSGTYNTDAALSLTIGNFAGGSTRTFDGIIDDVRIYNRALTLAEIQDLAATYKVIDLGTLSETRSLGLSINNSEQLAGFDENAATGDGSAWLAQSCAFTSIGTFAGGSVSEALGINDSGQVVGWSDNAAGDRKAFFYNGSLADLGTLSGRSDSEAIAVNASSEVVGSAMNFGTPTTSRLAFIYLPSPAYTLSAGMNSLGTLGGGQSVAMDINDSGQVAGGAESSDDYFRPFRWANGVMTDLGTLGGENGAILHRAQAINASGNVVGQSYTAGGAAHAFYWDGSMTDLGVLTGGDTSWALGINDGNVVVGTSNVTGGIFHAFVWDGTSGLRDLNNLIDTNSTWTLTRATDINNDGEIAGWGQNPSGNAHAFLLIQTCSASGPPGGLARGQTPLASGSALADSNGELRETAVSSEGEPLADIAITDADAGSAFEYVITGSSSNANDAPGPDGGTREGFAEGAALARTLVVDTPAQPGTYRVTISMTYRSEDLTEMGFTPEGLRLHVLDPTQGSPPGHWMPAGRDIGEAAPTGVVGESGFVVFTDGTVDYWAVRDETGIFAVGKPERDTARSVHSRRPAGLCGIGLSGPALLATLVFFIRRTGHRAH